MHIKLITSCLVIGFALLPSFAQSQTPAQTCSTVVVPDQGAGFGETKFVIPPRTFGGAEIVYTPPANATAVGLELWAHRIHTAGVPDPPKDHVALNGYIVHVPTGKIRLVIPVSNLGPSGDGVWHVFAMSTFLHKGESFVVGPANAWDKPVTVDLILTIRECVAS